MDLKNSTILITGGASGIGLEFVKQLTSYGANIIITGRDAGKLAEAKKKFPLIRTFVSDVSNPDDIEHLYKTVTMLVPELNILINNAGIMRLIDLCNSSDDLQLLTREISVNLAGTIQMTQQFLPHLSQQPSAAIINVSSAIAFMPYSSAPVYSASKAGVHAYTQALRLQLEQTNIKVMEVIPPGVETSLQQNWVMQPDPGMLMKAEKMVQQAIRGILNDKKEIRPGLTSLLKIASRLMPGPLIRFGHKEFRKFRELNQSVKTS